MQYRNTLTKILPVLIDKFFFQTIFTIVVLLPQIRYLNCTPQYDPPKFTKNEIQVCYANTGLGMHNVCALHMHTHAYFISEIEYMHLVHCTIKHQTLRQIYRYKEIANSLYQEINTVAEYLQRIHRLEAPLLTFTNQNWKLVVILTTFNRRQMYLLDLYDIIQSNNYRAMLAITARQITYGIFLL